VLVPGFLGKGNGRCWYAKRGANLALCARRVEPIKKRLKAELEKIPEYYVAYQSLDVNDQTLYLLVLNELNRIW